MHPLVRLANALRFYNIPALNAAIILVLGYFLFRLTTKYTDLYMKSSLFTIILTNLVLYGISETLAQSILCYRGEDPPVSFRMNPQDSPIALEDDFQDEEDRLESFISYIEDEPVARTYMPVAVQELSYFQFDRLAGFMCWGIVMGFCQCIWYKFLQIYASEPRFIEVLRKVLTDQLCYSPVSLFCFFTYGTMVLESGTWEDAKAKLANIYFKTLMINYSVWFPIQFFNFLVVPHSFQVPFSSSVSVLWNCFLSMRNSAAQTT